MNLTEFLSTFLFNIPILSYGNILAILMTIIITFFTRFIINKLVFKFFINLTKKTETTLDDLIIKAIKRPIGWIIISLGLFIAFYLLNIPQEVLTSKMRLFVGNILLSLVIAFVTWLLYALTGNIAQYFQEKAKTTEDKTDDALIPFIKRAIGVLILIIGALLIIQNLGFDVAGLVAGLGIGGFAIALASKDAISNIFGSATIFIDKAFRINDWIKIGDVEGVVEEIGLRSTRIRKFSKTLVIIPNEKLANSAIENFSQRPFRRISETIRIIHGTSHQKMRKILDGIRKVIIDHADISNDYYLVNFIGSDDAGLQIFIYCFATSADWKFYLDIKEDLLLKIMELLEKEGSKIAQPFYIIHKND